MQFCFTEIENILNLFINIENKIEPSAQTPRASSDCGIYDKTNTDNSLTLRAGCAKPLPAVCGCDIYDKTNKY